MNQYNQNQIENTENQPFNDILDIIPASKAQKKQAELITAACSRVPVQNPLTGEIIDQWDATIVVGADTHSKTHSLCAVNSNTLDYFMQRTVPADPRNIYDYCCEIQQKMPGQKLRFLVGYEAGCLGTSLAENLWGYGINCVIIAPTSIQTSAEDRVSKTDRYDAKHLATILLNGTYKPVWISDKEDQEVKDYIRMYEDIKQEQKELKQRINAFALRYGYTYGSSKWTKKHLDWLRNLDFSGLTKEAFDEYLSEFNRLTQKLETFEERIREIALTDRYRDLCTSLAAIKGIKLHSALAISVEIGDYNRFGSPEALNKYIGLIPTERSSGEKDGNRGSITKMGNSHVRRLLTECAQAARRGTIGYKSADLKARQKGLPQDVIDYADKAATRIRKKYDRMVKSGKPSNVAVTACARELLCFIWGMATGNIHGKNASPARAVSAGQGC